MLENQTTLCIHENMSWDQKRLAIQGALILGFQAEAAQFPIASLQDGINPPQNIEELASLLPDYIDNPILEDFVDATKSAKPIPPFDWRKKKGLEKLFETDNFLKDNNLDLLPDELAFKIVLPEESDASMVVAACNFAFRFGMETTAFEGFITEKEYASGNALLFQEAKKSRIYIDDQKVIVEGQGEDLIHFSSAFCESFPHLTSFETWARRLQEMTDSFTMKNLEGQLAYVDAVIAEKDSKIEAFVSPKIEQIKQAVEEKYPHVVFENYKGMKQIYEKVYDIPWEVDSFNQILEEKVYPSIKAGDSIEIYAALSEELPLRNQLMDKINQQISDRNATASATQIICSYKQGFSWIQELVLPQLADASNLQKFQIAFKPFLPEGVTDWKDEDGATPTYNVIGSDAEKWYDLPIRYLQELYPVEDVIAKDLQIDRDNIEFVLYEGDEDITYEIKAFDEKDKVAFKDTYKAACFERLYLDQYAQMGKVHPSTGYIKVIINGVQVLKERIETDVEAIWDIFQNSVLPDCRSFIEEKTNGCLDLSKQPFFSRLRLDVVASEPNYELESREDLFSTLDGLHEDMYFVAADYFKNYGLEKCGKMFEEPGLILPFIKKGEGKPYFKVTLFDQMKNEPCIVVDGQKIDTPKRADVALTMKEVSLNENAWNIKLLAEGINKETIKSYVKLLEDGKLFSSLPFGLCNKLSIICEDEEYFATLPSFKEEEKNLCIEDIDIMENQLIGYDDYIKIMEQIKKVPGVSVYQTAESYMGRIVYAIELLPSAKGYISRTKRITNHPSEIVNGRHHANEVSATNAAFILLKRLLTDETYKNLANTLNLVIVPMENVDGAAIHYELQKDNPTWKLHVARFNAIGKEFYYEHFKSETMHTEAMGLTRLFETFVPDIIIDNHGVPTHEWEQQFSGYTSPPFKGFWLPRSLLYGYFWTVSDDEYKSNYTVNKKMEDVVAEAIAKEPEMKNLNREWARQFEKYAHAWMPKLFPANYYKDMINYWIPFKADENHRYPSIRFPWITTVAYTSEVADETAQGDYLNLCARAHVTHDLAIFNMLINAKSIYENKADITAEKMNICHIRRRPIIV